MWVQTLGTEDIRCGRPARGLGCLQKSLWTRCGAPWLVVQHHKNLAELETIMFDQIAHGAATTPSGPLMLRERELCITCSINIWYKVCALPRFSVREGFQQTRARSPTLQILRPAQHWHGLTRATCNMSELTGNKIYCNPKHQSNNPSCVAHVVHYISCYIITFPVMLELCWWHQHPFFRQAEQLQLERPGAQDEASRARHML